jgi:hypothetical protein
MKDMDKKEINKERGRDTERDRDINRDRDRYRE